MANDFLDGVGNGVERTGVAVGRGFEFFAGDACGGLVAVLEDQPVSPAGARGQPGVREARDCVRADRLTRLVACGLLLLPLVRLQCGAHEPRELARRVSFMVAVHTCDDVCTPQAHLVEIGQVTFRADQDEWPRIVVLDGHKGAVDDTKHELQGFGVLVLTEREVGGALR